MARWYISTKRSYFNLIFIILMFGHQAVYSFLIGLCVGSFLNVVIYRLPRGEAIMWGRSRCPRCGERLAWYDLVPVLSFLVLRGKCRYCRGAIGLRYPVVELTAGLAFLLLWWRFGWGAALMKYAFFAGVLIAAGFIDAEHYLIPNWLVLAGLVGAVFLGPVARDVSLWEALAGGAAAGGVLLLLAVLSRGGMGGGDIKLAAVSGLFVGWPLAVIALFLASLLGSAAGIILLALRKKKRKDPIPFGPFLSLGFFAALIWGYDLFSWYLSLFI